MQPEVLPAFARIAETPPAAFTAEQAVLGALLANNAVYYQVSDFLQAEHFADAAHARVYDAMATLITRGEIANPVTLLKIAEQDGGLNQYREGAAQYLVDLAQAVVTVLNAVDYARLVHGCWIRRQLCRISAMVDEDARTFNASREVASILEDADQMIAHLSAGAGDSRRGTVSAGEASLETLQRIEAAMRTGYSGLSTGFVNINKITTGLQKTDLVIVAGATSMGKTTLALNIADNVAGIIRMGIAAEQLTPGGDGGGEVLYVSREMSREQLIEKFYSNRTEISTHRMRTGALDAEAFASLARAHESLIDLPLKIDDRIRTVAQLRAIAKRMRRGRGGLSLIVVDYLQLLHSDGDGRRDNRVAEVSAISRGLKEIAMDEDVPVIALSQLSRKLEERDDKRPILADLRESGSIEQDADIVLFAYRDEYYARRVEPRQRDSESDGAFQARHDKWMKRMEEVRNKAEVICAKNRHGPLKTAHMYFDGANSRFADLHDSDGPNDHGGGGGE
jgi:replicative DNA helicase